MSAPELLSCDVAVLGSGPGGYAAAFRAADLGLSEVIVKVHRGQVMRKMGAATLAELVRLADLISGKEQAVR